jgi:hypothetical protein
MVVEIDLVGVGRLVLEPRIALLDRQHVLDERIGPQIFELRPIDPLAVAECQVERLAEGVIDVKRREYVGARDIHVRLAGAGDVPPIPL